LSCRSGTACPLRSIGTLDDLIGEQREPSSGTASINADLLSPLLPGPPPPTRRPLAGCVNAATPGRDDAGQPNTSFPEHAVGHLDVEARAVEQVAAG
jgi:hypothetical protein